MKIRHDKTGEVVAGTSKYFDKDIWIKAYRKDQGWSPVLDEASPTEGTNIMDIRNKVTGDVVTDVYESEKDRRYWIRPYCKDDWEIVHIGIDLGYEKIVLQKFYVTFGQSHIHRFAQVCSDDGQTKSEQAIFDKDCVAIFEAVDIEAARGFAFSHFQGKWHNCHPYEGVLSDQEIEKWYPRGKIPIA